MGSPSSLPHLRSRRLLRLLARTARDGPLRGDGPCPDAVGGAGRGLGLVPFVDALYPELLTRGIQYFFPEGRLEVIGPAAKAEPQRAGGQARTGELEFDWLGLRYRLSAEAHLFSIDEARLLDGIQRVLSARYHLLFDAALAAQRLHLFRRLPEDRYVSAFLDPTPYAQIAAPSPMPDRVSDAIEVLRVSALTTHESRRIETGS